LGYSIGGSAPIPAIYPARVDAVLGGLISYGPDQVDQYRREAGHVDRILRGEKPADLPVQQVVKVELVINLKTAQALGLTFPITLLGRADLPLSASATVARSTASIMTPATARMPAVRSFALWAIQSPRYLVLRASQIGGPSTF
jgi:hypothetical protein